MKLIRILILATIAAFVIFLPKAAYALDIQMGSNGNLIFEPSDVTISSEVIISPGETIH
jgi:hypothetical protein